MDLLVLTNCRPFSGFDTYISNLYDAIGDHSSFINLLFEEKDLPLCSGSIYDPHGLISRGFFRSPRIRDLIARVAPSAYFKEFKKEFKNRREKGYKLHYSYNLLPIIENNSGDIVTIHDLIFMRRDFRSPLFHREYSIRLLRKYAKFEHILTESEFVKEQLLSFGSKSSITVVPSPTPSHFHRLSGKQELRNALGLPRDAILVLSPSNSKPWKNLGRIQKSISLLGDKYKLVRIGKKIGNEISFENVDNEEINMIYNACDVLLYPSLEEGFGFPIIEAFKVGLPTVVSDIPVFREVAESASMFVDPLDVKSISEGVIQALENRDELIKKGYELLPNYSKEAYKTKMHEFYRSAGVGNI